MSGPTWKYRRFRLRYVDHFGDDIWSWGLAWYPNGNRSDLWAGHHQLGIMFGHREAVFDLWRPRGRRS